jgi:ParB-like chromosome segregation protein Spo0J
MDKAKLYRYAELKKQIKVLEEEVGVLAPEVMEMMGDNKEVETDVGVFIKASKRKWSYPEQIVTAEKQLKDEKKQAEQLGDATYEENEYLLFKGY